jgi:hypothetical protein
MRGREQCLTHRELRREWREYLRRERKRERVKARTLPTTRTAKEAMQQELGRLSKEERALLLEDAFLPPNLLE